MEPRTGRRFKAVISRSAGSSLGVPANTGVLLPDLLVFLDIVEGIGEPGREEVGEEGPALAPAAFFSADTGPLGAAFSFSLTVFLDCQNRK
jgi:hypothetical protein